MSCWEISLQRDEEPDHGPHYLYHWTELESEGIRSEASDVEETSIDTILLGSRTLVTVSPVSPQRSPEMSLGSVHMWRSVGSLAAERTTYRGAGAGLGHAISLVHSRDHHLSSSQQPVEWASRPSYTEEATAAQGGKGTCRMVTQLRHGKDRLVFSQGCSLVCSLPDGDSWVCP